MEYLEFISRIDEFETAGIAIPFYYDLIDDNAIFTPKEIAALFGRDIKRVRTWFNPGLKHGAIPSFEPTRHKCNGRDLKEWLFKKDNKVILRNPKMKQIL